jgi:ergothioneine biosynthesis protein EgtB
MIAELHKTDLITKFAKTRENACRICAPLEIEDYVPQPVMDVSPPKWHLAHTTWFFEQFVLLPHMPGYREFDTDFHFLFNSYYNNLGERVLRHHRGFMTRPTVSRVYDYRQYVDEHMITYMQGEMTEEVLRLIETGLHHEQQHQELLVYDIKYILGMQPTYPAVALDYQPRSEAPPPAWLTFEAGLYPIGAEGDCFCFDNELPRHDEYISAFHIMNRLVTNGEYLEFMQDNGYGNFNLWHAEGWDFIQRERITAPLYWREMAGGWHTYTFRGLMPLDPEAPVQHLSYYEAYAFAEWKGMRLPTEFEWEVASGYFDWGQLWEWTGSAYLPYPGFRKAPGALGEYNGKFMLNQQVLRGASAATPSGHSRRSYRNFFHAGARWIYSGIRLAV